MNRTAELRATPAVPRRTVLAALLPAALLLLFPSCSSDSQDTPQPTPAEQGQEILFSVNTWQEARTRGSIVNTQSDLTTGSIAVSAVFSSADETVVYLDKNKLTSDDNGGQWNTDGKQYWPPQTLSFYARHPFTMENITDEDRMEHTGFKYTIPYDYEKQYDLMYAVTKDVTESEAKASTNHIVLNMKHALAAISFKAMTESSSMTVSVKDIDLCNVRTSGTFTYPEESTQLNVDKNVNCWSEVGVPADGNVILSAGISEQPLSSTAKDITPASTALFLIPQELKAWDPGTASNPKPVKTTTDGSGCYLRINCRVLSNGKYFSGGDSSYDYVYVPFSGEFEAGKHYEITLKFGLGYDSDGKTKKVVVSLTTASITSWTHTTISSEAPIYPDQN